MEFTQATILVVDDEPNDRFVGLTPNSELDRLNRQSLARHSQSHSFPRNSRRAFLDFTESRAAALLLPCYKFGRKGPVPR